MIVNTTTPPIAPPTPAALNEPLPSDDAASIIYIYIYIYVCVCVCVRACVHACVCAYASK